MKGNVLGRSPQCHDVSPTALEKGGNVRLDRGAPQHQKPQKEIFPQIFLLQLITQPQKEIFPPIFLLQLFDFLSFKCKKEKADLGKSEKSEISNPKFPNGRRPLSNLEPLEKKEREVRRPMALRGSFLALLPCKWRPRPPCSPSWG